MFVAVRDANLELRALAWRIGEVSLRARSGNALRGCLRVRIDQLLLLCVVSVVNVRKVDRLV